jgi:L-ascorbate metabolism protein UlaG (beta-lactamase superfamily)
MRELNTNNNLQSHVDYINHNLHLLSQYSNKSSNHLRVKTKIIKIGETHYKVNSITENNLLYRLFFSFFYTNTNRDKIKNVINSNVNWINTKSQKFDFEDQDNLGMKRLYINVLHYNRSFQNPDNGKLFAELGLNTNVVKEDYPELESFEVSYNKIPSHMPTDVPVVRELTGVFGRKYKQYHYQENLLLKPAIKAEHELMEHSVEAKRIFFSTLKDNVKSFIAQGLKKVSRGHIDIWKDSHYFRLGETQESIYELFQQLLANPQSNKNTWTWIGHAAFLYSYLFSKDGQKVRFNMLVDPVFSHLHSILYRRKTDPAAQIADLPPIDAIMISHNHRDHMEPSTLKLLAELQPNILMIVPVGTKKSFKKLGFKKVKELMWREAVDISIEQKGKHIGNIKIEAIPANHWGGYTPMCDGHESSVNGYLIKADDVTMANFGDTAKWREEHYKVLRDNEDVVELFVPGGPDDVRSDMESTHQSSAEGLNVHFNIFAKRAMKTKHGSVAEFTEEMEKFKTTYMHTKTYRLGNLHFDDTETSINRVITALKETAGDRKTLADYPEMKDYEFNVYTVLLDMINEFQFDDGDTLTPQQTAMILEKSVHVPKIGERANFVEGQ